MLALKLPARDKVDELIKFLELEEWLEGIIENESKKGGDHLSTETAA